MSYPWFRFYDEVADDPKVQLLPDRLFKAWVNFMCIANKHSHEEGILPKIEEIAYRLHVTRNRAESLLNELVEAGLFEWKDGLAVSHNWRGRQFNNDGAAERMRRYRERHASDDSGLTVTRNVTPNSDATLQKSVTVTAIRYTDTDTDRDKKEKPPIVPRSGDGFDRFWTAYPKKTGKGAAVTAWRKNGHPGIEAIEAVLARARATAKWLEENGRYIPNPATWLNQKRWDDEYITIDDEREAAEAKRRAIYGGGVVL